METASGYEVAIRGGPGDGKFYGIFGSGGGGGIFGEGTGECDGFGGEDGSESYW